MELRCKKRTCRTAYRYGYHVEGGLIFDKPLENKYLITSQSTAFEVLYLYELILMIFHGSCTFSSIAEIYNSLHYTKIQQNMTRYKLYEKRVSKAFFQYAMIDLSQRYDLEIRFIPENIDLTMENHYQELVTLIQNKWGDHRCATKGCGSCLVIDGGLKPQRKICAARTAGIFKFKHSPIETVVGCTRIPGVGEKFCREHLVANVPSLPANKMSKENVRKLRSSVKKVKDERTEEDVFNVVAIHEKKNSKKGGSSYLIEWEGYEERTWEPEKNIPKFLRDYFEETGNKVIPKPRVKSTKNAGSATYYLLTWDDSEASDQYVPAADFLIGKVEEDEIGSNTHEEQQRQCNTRKHHGARYCQTSAGILIGAFPCGVIPLFAELFGVESISQVYGHVVDWLGESDPQHMQFLLYDDACHLGPFAMNPKRTSHSHATTTMGNLRHIVDKLHFKGHRGVWCHDNCNPYAVPALKDVNSVICEQGSVQQSHFSS